MSPPDGEGLRAGEELGPREVREGPRNGRGHPGDAHAGRRTREGKPPSHGPRQGRGIIVSAIDVVPHEAVLGRRPLRPRRGLARLGGAQDRGLPPPEREDLWRGHHRAPVLT